MNQNFNFEVGEKLKKARKAKKMSMKRLGELVHLHESTISRYENGEINSLDIDKLKEFATVLEISPMYLIGYENEPHPHRVRKSMSLEEFANEFDIDFDRLEEVFSVASHWKNEIGVFDFSEAETEELISYAKYLKSKRRPTK